MVVNPRMSVNRRVISAAFAPQTQLLGVFQHLLDHRGGHVRFEGLADPYPFPLLRQEPLHGDAHIDQDDGQQGVEELQVEVQTAEQEIINAVV